MMLFNDQGKIENIVPVQRNDAHRLIEECMLAANVCASAFLQKLAGRACTTHSPKGRRPKSWRRCCSFLHEFGLGLPGERERRQGLRCAAGENPARNAPTQLLQTVMLRCCGKRCTAGQRGHFGLSEARYTHFTSPIRRYPDLALVHRSIRPSSTAHRYTPGSGTTSACIAR